MIYARDSSPDTDDEYDAMEDVRTRFDASIARNLQEELNAEAAGLASGAARPSSRPGITIGRSARPSGAPRQPTAALTVAPSARSKRRISDRPPLSADPIPEDYCHNPIFTHGIFSGVGAQNGTARTRLDRPKRDPSLQNNPGMLPRAHFPESEEG